MLSVIALAGLSIDGSNGLRAKEQLRTAADVAAHAGAVAMAKGADEDEIRTAVNTGGGDITKTLMSPLINVNSAGGVEIGCRGILEALY